MFKNTLVCEYTVSGNKIPVRLIASIPTHRMFAPNVCRPPLTNTPILYCLDTLETYHLHLVGTYERRNSKPTKHCRSKRRKPFENRLYISKDGVVIVFERFRCIVVLGGMYK